MLTKTGKKSSLSPSNASGNRAVMSAALMGHQHRLVQTTLWSCREHDHEAKSLLQTSGCSYMQSKGKALLVIPPFLHICLFNADMAEVNTKGEKVLFLRKLEAFLEGSQKLQWLSENKGIG